MTTRRKIAENQLLSQLPPDSLKRLGSNLKLIDAKLRHPLYAAYEPITHIYFPVNALGSIVASTGGGRSTEIGVVGSEGIVGHEALLGVKETPYESFVQIAGPIYQLPVANARKEFARGELFHDLVLLFVHKHTVQVSQTTLCNRLHHLEQRLPRWLLMCHDRIEGDVLRLTQEFIALMLGSSRVTVTLASRELQSAGYIQYVRGKITVIDRDGLEAAACECYHTVRDEYARPLGR